MANSGEAQLSKNAEAKDKIQRDIFVIGLNDTYKRFRSDVISRETFATLTFAQVIAKAQDFEDGLKTELLSHSTIFKRMLPRSHQTRSLRLRLLSKLLKPALLLANGVARHLTAVVVNAEQRMLHVLFMVNVAIWQHVCKAPWVNQPQDTQQVYNNCNTDKIKIKMRLESI